MKSVLSSGSLCSICALLKLVGSWACCTVLESGRWLTPSLSSSWQVIVWGDYGRMDHKCFMGMAQIMLDELDLSAAVTGWYKLFPTSSVADSTLGSLTRRLSQSSLESATSPSCS